MHLLASQQVGIDSGLSPVDLGQSPADCVFLSSADSELACLARAQQQQFSLRLANLRYLTHPFSIDLYLEKTLSITKIVIVRLLGGKSYWAYGCEQLAQWAKDNARTVVFLPGDTAPDPELRTLSTIQDARYDHLVQYCLHGGVTNAEALLKACDALLKGRETWPEACPLDEVGLYLNKAGNTAPLAEYREHFPLSPKPRALLLFYRALVQAADTAVIDALIIGYHTQGITLIPVFATSLKTPHIAAEIRTLIQNLKPDLIVNTMGFALAKPGESLTNTALGGVTVPIQQVIFASLNREDWQDSAQGLGSSDLAMHIALPEIDGKIISRAVSFKGVALEAPWAEYQIIGHCPEIKRIAFSAELAAGWIKLARKPNAEKRLAILLAHYPNKNARMGNGVGLDTPASIMTLIPTLRQAGYTIPDPLPFEDGDGLIRFMQAGVNNTTPAQGEIRETIGIQEYLDFFTTLPDTLQQEIRTRWGAPENDPSFHENRQVFALGLCRFGGLCLGLQPARGYHINPQASYHDPALIPPHGYLAFYVWLRKVFDADAIIQFGKHGNLEWLPGKALALSETCYPEAVHGAVPSIYPFIINDPGEGTQAKRRTASVIIDHLMPALTRAGNEGELGRLEMLVDEYFQAGQIDPRRQKPLKIEILSLIERWGISDECGISDNDDATQRLQKLDGYLCELKELQIRDGLHSFGRLANGESLNDLLVSLLRLPRGNAAHQASILHALARDFALDKEFDPLDLEGLYKKWHDDLPQALQTVSNAPIRLYGDVRERLELFAVQLIAGHVAPPGSASAAVLKACTETLLPLLQQSVEQETAHILRALEGRYIPAGPSGAPTRNRWDVLPSGRNFFSVDSRALPTQTAWHLGWKSAQLLLERHAQDHGDYPKTLAMSAWGTANMRTGGDDIAQVLALIGARPTWQQATGRVTGFEILPPTLLGRPRIDVTLRISGFFRDAFPDQIILLDQAIRAVAALDETAEINPLAANVARETTLLIAEGLEEDAAAQQAAARIYGSEPEAYGAGLQSLMDSGGWENRSDLARTFIRWGGFRYGADDAGSPDFAGLERRLRQTEVVSHNQDNREHDLLDSDDYYQFQGGLTATVASLSETEPVVYHNDHSNPARPQIRLLSEELARVVRARVTNPKWLRGMMRHGYKGAFEMTASIDYLFSYAATTHLVSNALFDAVARAYIDNPEVCTFLKEHNPDALTDIAARLQEAIDRDLWRPHANHHTKRLQEILES